MLIRWPATKPSSRKLASSEPDARVTPVPEIVTLPLNSWVARRPPIEVRLIRPPVVTSVWPSVSSATWTSEVGALVSRSV